MSSSDWIKIGVDVLQAIISGVFVGLVIFWLDERRAVRERRLSDFRIASNWLNTEPKVSLRNFDLTRSNLSGNKFIRANLEGAVIADSGLWGTNFSEANLIHADFRKSRLVGAKLTKAKANGADFGKATITKRSDPDYKYLPDFSGASLKGAKFVGAQLNGVSLIQANLKGADFSRATILECDFTGADLTDSNWKKVKRVENCIWKDAKVSKSEKFPPELWEEIRRQNAK